MSIDIHNLNIHCSLKHQLKIPSGQQQMKALTEFLKLLLMKYFGTFLKTKFKLANSVKFLGLARHESKYCQLLGVVLSSTFSFRDTFISRPLL